MNIALQKLKIYALAFRLNELLQDMKSFDDTMNSLERMTESNKKLTEVTLNASAITKNFNMTVLHEKPVSKFQNRPRNNWKK